MCEVHTDEPRAELAEHAGRIGIRGGESRDPGSEHERPGHAGARLTRDGGDLGEDRPIGADGGKRQLGRALGRGGARADAGLARIERDHRRERALHLSIVARGAGFHVGFVLVPGVTGL
ncbi:hypothetical protein GCM10009808_01630 [Microbacterium sediminicola]|uniref:Uncharacterized protein n=1 Tax=Microbacterium sediminicola TaxID=415210 RepID=A0ABN2HIU0_9MICO